jgi:hypothetical protein
VHVSLALSHDVCDTGMDTGDDEPIAPPVSDSKLRFVQAGVMRILSCAIVMKPRGPSKAASKAL